MRQIILLALLVLGWWPTGAQAAASADDIDAWVRARLEGNNVPGAAWAIVSSDGSVRISTLGDGITEDSPFVIGSVSKSFTATLVMQLVERGDLSLDTTVGETLPWLDPADERMAEITIGQLLNHTSGISEEDGLALSTSYDNSPDGLSADAESLAEIDLAHDPGTTHEYSDANYTLLGAIIEEVSGQPYADVLQSALLDGLGMTHTGASPDQADSLGLVDGHRYVFGQPRVYNESPNLSGAAYGFLYSSPSDMARWLQFQMNGDPAVLGDTAREDMHAGSVEAYEGTSYAMGWRDSAANDEHPRRIWHGGANPNFGTFVGFEPDSGYGVVLLQNVFSPLKDADLMSTGFGMLDMLGARDPQESGSGLMYPGALAVGAVLTIGGITVALWSLRRGRALRLLTTVVVAAVAGLLGWVILSFVPEMFGGTSGLMRTWAPDIFWLGIAAVAAWILAALVRVAGHVIQRTREDQSVKTGLS